MPSNDYDLEQKDEPSLEIKVDPVLDGLRSDPRYAALLKRMGLASQFTAPAEASPSLS